VGGGVVAMRRGGVNFEITIYSNIFAIKFG
jgi:hypothetical protein